MRKKETYTGEKLKGLVSRPEKKESSLLVLLHGVGANEEGLLELGEVLAPEATVVSLRAPIQFGPSSFAWFQVQFTPQGPVHNWSEARRSFELLEKEIDVLSRKYEVPLSKISVMGFSQGSIMTMGLALMSPLKLGHYLCFSGRTLPEFADYALKNPEVGKDKKVYLVHGLFDEKLPVTFARKSREILQSISAKTTYNEFQGGHEVSLEVVKEASQWLLQ